MLLPGFWRFVWHSPYLQLLHPLAACNWLPSSCCPHAESQSGWVCVHCKSMWALHTESPVNPAVSSASPIPTDFFYSKKLWGFIFLSLGNWAVQSGLRMGLVIPKVSLPIFIHNTWIWDHPFHLCHHLSVPCRISVPFWPLCMASPLLPMCMSVASLNPWLSGLHTAQFSDGSECYLFWGLVVILSVVTQGGKAYLSIPPSWEEFHLEILNNLSLLFFFFCSILTYYVTSPVSLFLDYFWILLNILHYFHIFCPCIFSFWVIAYHSHDYLLL